MLDVKIEAHKTKDLHFDRANPRLAEYGITAKTMRSKIPIRSKTRSWNSKSDPGFAERAIRLNFKRWDIALSICPSMEIIGRQ